MVTATFTACPFWEVPPPRGSTGTPWLEHTRIVATMSATVRGSTTPIGTCR
jgi:hypothetical protein